MNRNNFNRNAPRIPFLFIVFVSIFSLLFFNSCSYRKTVDSKSNIEKPLIIDVSAYKKDLLDYSAPTLVASGNPIITKCSNLEWVKGNSHVRTFSEPTLLKIIEPTPLEIGKNGLINPTITPIITNSKVCSAPEMVLVKDAYIKDQSPYNFVHYGVLQGLLNNQVRSMAQDNYGNMWFGSDDGLTKYDGKFFYHYTKKQGLNNNLILSIFEDKNKNIWAGSFRGGATKFDGISLTFFTTQEGFPNNVVNAITEDTHGNIWFATGNGLVCYNGYSITTYTTDQGLLSNDIRSILQDKSGQLWIATMGGGISLFDGTSFKNYSKEQGFPDNNVLAIIQDNKGIYWIGTSGNGVVKFDGTNFYHYTTDNGLQDNLVRSITNDKDGNIWIACAANGISKFDGKHFTVYGKEEGLASDYIRFLMEDKDGVLWMGTRSAGVCRFIGNAFTHYTENNGLTSNRVMSIFEENENTLWLGTYGGYAILLTTRVENGDTLEFFSSFGKEQGLQGSRVYSIIKDSKGNIWFGTDGGGITKYDGKYTYTYNKSRGLAGNEIRDIVEDNSGNIWIATYGNGISLFNGETFTNYNSSSGLTTDNVLALHLDRDGNIWIGTDGGGISMFHNGHFTHYDASIGFKSTIIYNIAEEKDGTLWFGSGGEGLIRYDGIKFYFYDKNSGLNNDHVISVLVDSQDNLWAGTRTGINIISKNQLQVIKDSLKYPIYENYSYEDGFIGMSCNLGALEQSKDGTVWIGTTDRLTSFKSSIRNGISEPLNLEITDVKLHYSSIPWSTMSQNRDTSITLDNGVVLNKLDFSSVSKWFGLPQELVLLHNNNYLTFTYGAISHSHNKQVRYKYKLEGLEENWSSFTDRTEVSYGNLNPGKFVFKVKALDSRAVWTKENEFSFTIRPPWYNTTLFYSILLLSVSYSIYLYIKAREIRLQKENAILEIKVKEKTQELVEKNSELETSNIEKDKFFSIIAHDLRGPFNGFLGLTKLMAEDIDSLSNADVKNIAFSMKKSASNIYNLLENLLQWSRLRNSSISFNPSSFNLITILKENIESCDITANNKEIKLLYDIPESLNVTADPNMFLTILRNLVSNAIKFTPKNGEVKISASKNEHDYIVIEVSDNGIGMSPNTINNLFKIDTSSNRRGTDGEPSTGLGLIICKEFVETHGGALWVESEEGKGSHFYFTLPKQV